MILANSSIQESAPETLIVFGCRGPGAKNRLHRERRAWGSSATLESLAYGRAELVVRPGGAPHVIGYSSLRTYPRLRGGDTWSVTSWLLTA
jgi:hypothetical protein